MSTPVSKHQIQALLRMSASPDGRLIPQRGGYWTVRGMETLPSRGFTGLGGTPRPAWYITTLTVRALERRQWVERARVAAEPWQDERQLTEKGREAYKQHLLTRDNTPKES